MITINDTMTLDEKLVAIDAGIAAANPVFAGNNSTAPIDPADLTMCVGCQ